MTRSLRTWLRRARPERRRLLEAIGISLLAAAASIVLLGGSGLLVGKAAGGGGLAALGVLLVVIELVAFLRAPLRYEERIVTHRVALGSMVRWRSWLYDVVVERLPGSLSALSSGELLERAVGDVDALEDLWVRLALPSLSAAATALLAAAVLAFVLPLAGAIFVGGVVLVVLGVGVVARGAGVDADAEARWRGLASAATADLVIGLAELTMAGTTRASLERIAQLEEHRSTATRRAGRRRGLGLVLVGLASGLVILGVALSAAHGAHQGQITAAEAAAITLVAVAGVEPLVGLLLAALRAPEVAASAERLDELAAAPLAALETARPLPWPTGGELVFEHVAAATVPGGVELLRDVSLHLAAGERVALLGSSGAGKSTICSLILRFLEPTQGAISIGGCSFSELSGAELREHVALLDQSPAFFGGTVADCLRLGAPSADEAQLREVLDLVDLSELDLEGAVAEAGASLSGGQQRRLALARVLLRRPALLLLDEPTAGLDEHQGVAVLERCLAAAGSAGVLLLTHRVAETSGFDRVYVLADGVLSQLDGAARETLLG